MHSFFLSIFLSHFLLSVFLCLYFSFLSFFSLFFFLSSYLSLFSSCLPFYSISLFCITSMFLHFSCIQMFVLQPSFHSLLPGVQWVCQDREEAVLGCCIPATYGWHLGPQEVCLDSWVSHCTTNFSIVYVPANSPYFIGTVPYFNPPKREKESDFTMCPYFCKNLSIVMYTKFRNVPIF